MQMRHSIIRRSFAVAAFYVLGHGFNYLLLATTNRMLAPQIFGLFYISISLINVLLTPGLVLAMSFGQRFAEIAASGGPGAVVVALRRILRVTAQWGTVAATVAAAVLAVFGWLIGIESFAVVVFIPAVACAAVIFEIIRAAFQGLQRFAWFSVSWVIWCALQYSFSVAGLYLVGTVWAGLIGFVLATVIMSAIALAALSWRPGSPPPTAAEGNAVPSLKLDTIGPLVLAYGLFTVLVNLDVLLGYLLLSGAQLGVYVASSIFPKAIVTATLPVAQVLLPVIAARASAAESTRSSIVKAVVAGLVLASTGAVVLKLGGDVACNSRIGLRFCDVSLMTILAFAAIPLSTLRVLVVSSLALEAYRQPLLQVLALAVIAALAIITVHGDAHRLAVIYFAVCSGVTLVYLAVDLLSVRQPTIKVRL